MGIVKITGVHNTPKFHDYVASHLVDVAYIQEINGDVITLSLEEGINLNSTDDKNWIMGLINQALVECQELLSKISLE